MSGKRGVWVPLKGVHKVRRKLADGTYRTHYYAWRGGPKLDPEDLEGSYHRLTTERKEELARQRSNTVAAGLAQFRQSMKFRKRAASYQKDAKRLHNIIAEEFGLADVSILSDRRVRRPVIKLRDRYQDRPRFADLLTGEITAFANWLYNEGRIEPHCVSNIDKLHNTNRADIIWEPHELDAICAVLPPHNAAVVRVAAGTGLDLPDLLSLTWTQIRRFSIETRRAKTGELALPILLPTVTEVLDGLDRRAVQVFTRPDGQPITVSGFRTAFGKAKAKLGQDKRFKDLRGTAATAYVRAGVKKEELPLIMGWDKKWVDRIILRYVTGEVLSRATLERIQNRTVNGPVNGGEKGTSQDPKR